MSSSRDQLVMWLQYSRQNTLPTKSTTGSSKETVRQLSDNSLIRQKFAISSVNFYSTRMFDTIDVVQTSSSRKPFERKCYTKVRTYIKVKCHTVNRTQLVSIRRIQYTMDDFYAWDNPESNSNPPSKIIIIKPFAQNYYGVLPVVELVKRFLTWSLPLLTHFFLSCVTCLNNYWDKNNRPNYLFLKWLMTQSDYT